MQEVIVDVAEGADIEKAVIELQDYAEKLDN